jgi:acetyltransferase-like isoleucine patch superfamily enzyme
MNIKSDADFLGVDTAHPLAQQFMVIRYKDGGLTVLPRGFFRTWLDEEAHGFNFHIGSCSGFGVGSSVKYDAGLQCLRVGRFVSGGLKLRFLLNGQHEINTISTYMFSGLGDGFLNAPQPQYGDSILKNDIWLGDEVMMLGGGIVESGCVIGARALLPPDFRSEPYGIYAGSPARLIRFRFSEKVREALLDLAWWDQPLSWILANNSAFAADLNADEGRSLELLAGLKASRPLPAAGNKP